MLSISKRQTAAGFADEAEVVELGHRVGEDGDLVSQLGVGRDLIAGRYRHLSAVWHINESNNPEKLGQALIGAPVGRQLGACVVLGAPVNAIS